MAAYLAPGVYVEEVETGAMPIEGVGTSTVGFLGETERGPTEPTLVTSHSEFRRVFGGRARWSFEEDAERSSYLTYAVDGFFRNGGSRCFVARIAQQDPEGNTDAVVAESALSDEVTVRAIGPGAWGNNVLVTVEDSPLGEDRFNLRVRYWYAGIPDDAADPPDEPDEADVPDPDLEELYADLSINQSDADHYAKSINSSSNLIQVTENATEIPAPDDPIAVGEDETGEDGGTVGADDFKGYETTPEPTSPEATIKRTGLEGFKEVDEIAIVCAPDENSETLTGLRENLLQHCQETKDRFAVFQAAQGQTPGKLSQDGLPPEVTSDRGLAAFYYPWIKVLDPLTNVETLVPPGGHVAGVYARTDTERGVHKAPANEQLQGVQALEHNIRKVDQDGLNPKNINCIRSFRGRGIRVWGARTTSSQTNWRYVNVRRLFLYLEESIDEGTQWVVFEPNDENLWARIRQSVGNFLTTVWRDGALMGTTPEEAFYVKCDRTTMTQAEIDLGRVVVEVGVAPVKPAEFVIFRISQWTGGAEST